MLPEGNDSDDGTTCGPKFCPKWFPHQSHLDIMSPLSNFQSCRIVLTSHAHAITWNLDFVVWHLIYIGKIDCAIIYILGEHMLGG